MVVLPLLELFPPTPSNEQKIERKWLDANVSHRLEKEQLPERQINSFLRLANPIRGTLQFLKALVIAVAYLDYKQKFALIFNQELSCCSSNSFELMFRDRDNCDWKAQTRISISHGDVKYSY